MKRVTGYTQGVFDMFHIGHLNLLKNAKDMCDSLSVGVNSDELTVRYKNKMPIIPEGERLEIVRAVKYVDVANVTSNLSTGGEQLEEYKKRRYDIIFVGEDHRYELRWQQLEAELVKIGSRVVYLPYTQHTNSTKLRAVLDGKVDALLRGVK
jgi:glycerol-3-phosphate cytidylyltransferase